MILFSKSKIKNKTFSCYLQIEVLISLTLLVISIGSTALGWSFFYQQIYTRRVFSSLNRSVVQISRQLDANYYQWSTDSHFMKENLTPLYHVQADYFTPSRTLEQMLTEYPIDLFSSSINLPFNFFIAKKNISISEIDFEQIYYYGYVHINERLLHAYTSKIYKKPTT